MSVYVSTRRHCHGDRRQQHAHETGETQETARPLDRVADLRTGIRDVTQALASLLVCAEPCLEGLDAIAIARKERCVAHPATRLNQLRAREILRVHDECGGKFGERAALVRARDQYSADTKSRRTDRDLSSQLAIHGRKHFGVGPHFTGRRNRSRRSALCERLVGDEQIAA
jgi:hypothetical protein